MRLLIAGLGSAGLAAAAAATASYAVAASAHPDPHQELAPLGVALLAFGVGMLTWIIALLTLTTVGVRWALPPGRRLVTTMVLVAGNATVVLTTWSAWTADTSSGLQSLWWAVALLTAIFVAAIAAAASATVKARPAVAVGAVAFVLFALLKTVAGTHGSQVAEEDRTGRYVATGAPLALINGQTVQPPVSGWTIVSVDQGWALRDVTVILEPGPTPTSPWVNLRMSHTPDPAPCERPGAARPCDRLGTRDDGAVIWGDPIVGFGAMTGYNAVFVDVPGGRWAINGTNFPQALDTDASVTILRSLQGVDAATFTAATTADRVPR
jgi:hypothetical protein